MSRRARVSFVFVFVTSVAMSLLFGCGRGEGGDGASTTAHPAEPRGEASGAPSAIADTSVTADTPDTPDTPERVVARRTTLAHPEDEPLLRPHLADVREHFGDGAKLELQALPLSEVRTAVLLSDGTKHLILAIESRGGEASTIAWSKKLPLAGTFPGATDLALAGGPRGELHLAWFDPTTKTIAFRRWRFDGQVEADWMLGHVDACDAVSAVYWPRQGFMVAASNLGTARLFVLDSAGTLRWKNGVGLDLERTSRAPLTLLPDSDASIIAVGIGTARQGNRHAPEHVLATRIDASGDTLWDAPVDLGAAAPNVVRVEGHAIGPGRVSVAIGPRRTIELSSAGVAKPR